MSKIDAGKLSRTGKSSGAANLCDCQLIEQLFSYQQLLG
jgi:hypothetical protein